MRNLIYIALILSFPLTGCNKDSDEMKNMDKSSESCRYLALGDSYTIGESVTGDQRWPVLLSAGLRKNGISISGPKIIAKTGWTTNELLTGIKTSQTEGTFDLVSLLIGVNNQYRGYDMNEYRKEFITLLDTAVKFAGGKPGNVIVLSIPDWGITPFAKDRDRDKISGEIDEFNNVNREETEQIGAFYIDITPYSRTASGDSTLIAGDGLHPSGKMYAEWAAMALPAAVKILKKKP